MHKKAGLAIEDLTGLLIFMFIAVFVVLFFKFIDFMGDKQVTFEVENQIESLKANDALLHFLKSPAKSDLGDNMADLIIQSYLEEDNDLLRKSVKDHFDNIYNPENTPWRLIIITPSERTIFKEGKRGYATYTGPDDYWAGYNAPQYSTAVARIPTKNDNVPYLEVSFELTLFQ
ncbi:hypothetical protein GOV14_04745 [Candidatus Pacearchaeota archaeon]|nr:hypothetical protein [Candidatus Pacearchaeota archaeon]